MQACPGSADAESAEHVVSEGLDDWEAVDSFAAELHSTLKQA